MFAVFVFAVFTFSVKLEKWSFHVADLPRTRKKCTEIKKKHEKGVQSFCFCSLNMQILCCCRNRRVVDHKLPISFNEIYFRSMTYCTAVD